MTTVGALTSQAVMSDLQVHVGSQVSLTPVIGSVEYGVLLFHLARSETRAFPLEVETNVDGTVQVTIFGVIEAGVFDPTVSSMNRSK